MTEKLIGLCGYAQAGKDTAAANMPGRTLRAEKARERSAAWRKKTPGKMQSTGSGIKRNTQTQ